MKQTFCDRCGKEQNIKNMSDFITKEGVNKNIGENKLTVRRLVARKVKWFGLTSIMKMIDFTPKWIHGSVDYDICENCQESFNTWLDTPDYEAKIIQKTLENSEEAKEQLELLTHLNGKQLTQI